MGVSSAFTRSVRPEEAGSDMRKILSIAVFLTLAIVACSSSVDLEATPDIRIGEDICEECGMIISEEVHSSAYRLTTGEQKSFDDIGDMVVRYRLRKGEDEIAAFWVHDFKTIEWIRAEDAFFVASYDLVTPMGHGIAAFENREDADALADDINGVVHEFQDLLAQPIFELSRESHSHSHD